MNQVIPFIIYLAGFIFLVHRIYTAPDAISRRFAIILTICFILLTVVMVVTYQEHMHRRLVWWQHVLRNEAIIVSTLLSYFLLDQLCNNRSYSFKTFIRYNVVPITVTVSILGGIVDYLRRSHFVSIWSPSAFERSWIHASSYCLLDTAIMLPGVLSIRTMWRAFQYYKDVSFRCRVIAVMITYIIGVIIMLVGTTNALFSVVFNNHFRVEIYNIIDNIGIPFVLLSTVLNSALPNRLYLWLISPLTWYLSKRRQRRQALLQYLHRYMTQIVPQVKFQGDQLGPLRLNVEIRDARRMIWSQIEHTQPLTPEAEAEQLMKFVRTKQVIAASGPFSPPPRQQKVLQHDLAVAAHLKRLEQQSPALFLDTPRLDHE